MTSPRLTEAAQQKRAGTVHCPLIFEKRISYFITDRLNVGSRRSIDSEVLWQIDTVDDVEFNVTSLVKMASSHCCDVRRQGSGCRLQYNYCSCRLDRVCKLRVQADLVILSLYKTYIFVLAKLCRSISKVSEKRFSSIATSQSRYIPLLAAPLYT